MRRLPVATFALAALAVLGVPAASALAAPASTTAEPAATTTPTTAAAPAEPTTTAAAPIDVVEVTGLLDPVVVDWLHQRLDEAESDGSQALVIHLNSKAAVVSEAEVARLAEHMRSVSVPVGVWVGPSGARALGLAGQLVFAADVVGMASGARLGDFGDAAFAGQDLGPATASLRDGTLGAADALTQGVVDVDAPVLGFFIVGLDGIEAKGVTLRTATVVQGDDGPTREAIAPTRFSKLGLGARMLHTAASPPVAYLLLSIGLALLVFEFFTAGVGIAGVCGAGCLVLAGYGLGVLPFRGWALALILASMFGFSVDVQTGVPRFWTGFGTLAYTIGSLSLYRGGLSLSWVTLAAGIAGMLLAFLVGMPTMVRTRFATPTIGREWMIGEMGEAVDEVAPDGVVRVRDALWPARTNRATPIGAGGRVRVVAIDGLVLEVEPEQGGARDHRERRRPSQEASPGAPD